MHVENTSSNMILLIRLIYAFELVIILLVIEDLQQIVRFLKLQNAVKKST